MKTINKKNKFLIFALMIFIIISLEIIVINAASYRTPNFIVNTADPEMAKQIALAAEKYRRDLAIAWTGQELPGNWQQPCVITVNVGSHLGAGGSTTFLFDRGEVYGWRMNIQGSAERVLDSVLPHEITHMIFASVFRAPVPRWADEGGATSVEHENEIAKHHRMLQQFLRTGRGIAFSNLFAMTEYPADVMPLYAQGFSLAEFLIMQGGRKKFIDFIKEGMQTRDWASAIKKYYGYNSLGVLQNSWLAWVAQGYPVLSQASSSTASGCKSNSDCKPNEYCDKGEPISFYGHSSLPGLTEIYYVNLDNPLTSGRFFLPPGFFSSTKTIYYNIMVNNQNLVIRDFKPQQGKVEPNEKLEFIFNIIKKNSEVELIIFYSDSPISSGNMNTKTKTIRIIARIKSNDNLGKCIAKPCNSNSN